MISFRDLAQPLMTVYHTSKSEAAIIIGYPSPKDRGFYLAVWQTAKAAGPIVGGAINLGLNANRKTAGSVGPATYIVFIVIMCLGLPFAICLSPAQKGESSRLI